MNVIGYLRIVGIAHTGEIGAYRDTGTWRDDERVARHQLAAEKLPNMAIVTR